MNSGACYFIERSSLSMTRYFMRDFQKAALVSIKQFL